MIAIARFRLLLLIRLTLAVALVGYILPAAGFSLTGGLAVSHASALVSEVAGQGHDSHHGDHKAGHVHAPDHSATPAAGHHHGDAAQDCCSDLCLNLALLAEASPFVGMSSSGPHPHRNDAHVSAEPIGFSRPPSIRA